MLIAGDLKTYVDYFESWAKAEPGIKFFAFGSVEKGLDYARSFPDFDYPFCWLEQPVIKPASNGAGFFTNAYHTGISIICQAPLDNNQAQIDAYAEALALVTKLHARLINDHNKSLLQFDTNSLQIEAVSQMWIDGHFGFRMELVLDLYHNKALFKK